jgi:hypothetical protein
MVFDIYCEDKTREGGLAPRHFPGVCLAIMRMLEKFDCATVAVDCAGLCYAAQLRQWLVGKKLLSVEEDCPLRDADIDKYELDILKALGWKVSYPNLVSWYSTLCSRANVLTEGQCVSSLSWVWQEGSVLTQILALQQSAISCETPPKLVASGVLMVGLIVAGLIPAEVLWDGECSLEAWKLKVAVVAEHLDSHVHQSKVVNDLAGMGMLTRILDCTPAYLTRSCENVLDQLCTIFASVVSAPGHTGAQSVLAEHLGAAELEQEGVVPPYASVFRKSKRAGHGHGRQSVPAARPSAPVRKIRYAYV